jgi:hypothetical protein
MIREFPPLALEGIDPWEKVQVDPSSRRLAEYAAAAAGLAVEEWLERAIRRACPSAFRNAPAAPIQPPAPPVMAPPPVAPRPNFFAAPPQTAPAPQTAPPEIEASLASLLAMAQRQLQSQTAPAAPIETAQAPTHYAPPPQPVAPPLPSFLTASPIAYDPAPVMRAAPAPMPPMQEVPAPRQHAPTIAERLAQQHFDEPEYEAEPAPLKDDRFESRDWSERDVEPRMMYADDEQEERPQTAKNRFKLWATTRDQRDQSAAMDEPADDMPLRGERPAVAPVARKNTRRIALIAVGIALAVTAGAVTAQFLIPNRPNLSRFTSSASAPVSNSPAPIFAPAPSNPPPLPSFNDRSNGPSNYTNAPGVPSLPQQSMAAPVMPSALPPSNSNIDNTIPANLPPVPGLPTLSSNPAPMPTQNTAALPPTLPPAPSPVTSPAVSPLATLPPAQSTQPAVPTSDMMTKQPLAKNTPPAAKAKPATPEPKVAAATSVATPPGAKTAKIDGEPAPTDPKALAPWLETRAKNGDAIAQYRLGVLYSLGQGVTQDYQRAASLFKSAADGNVAEAQYNIAVMYGEGLGIGRDPTQAVAWYRKAAGQGNANAAFNLGVAYSNGIGIQQNMDQAAQWFRRAAGSGIVNAQFNLGLLYERGDGVPVSQVEAYAWYSAAANHGDTGAGQRRDRLASTLSPSTLKEAQARAQQVLTTIQNGANNAPAGGMTSATPAAARR